MSSRQLPESPIDRRCLSSRGWGQIPYCIESWDIGQWALMLSVPRGNPNREADSLGLLLMQVPK